MDNYNLTQVSVLIVENHPHLSSMLRGILRELGITDVYDAWSPEAGLEEVNLRLHDVLLVG